MAGMKFVVVCRQGAALHSRLVSALDRYRMDFPQLRSEQINDYLKTHFSVTDAMSAARVDAER